MGSYSPGFHSYHPFRTSGGRPDDETSPPPSMSTLQDRCKHCILQRVPLRRLREEDGREAAGLGGMLPLPLLRFLRSFSTEDFVEMDCAPLVDMFELNFYHRAMTYKVRSKYDRCEYVATHGFTAGHDDRPRERAREREAWMHGRGHEHLMLVCGSVTDHETGNVFYLLPVPQVSLEHVQRMLFKSRMTVPEIELWKLAHHLSSALLHVQALGLCYGAFGLDNIFLVDDKIVLENELTRKSRMYLLSRVDVNLWKRIPSEPWHRPQSKSDFVLRTSEVESLWYLGYILDKLANVQKDDDDDDNEPMLFHFETPDNEIFYTNRWSSRSGNCYSDELCRLIADTQVNVDDKLSLSDVQRLSGEMVARSKTTETDDGEKPRNGLLEMAKEEFAIQKQSRWR